MWLDLVETGSQPGVSVDLRFGVVKPATPARSLSVSASGGRVVGADAQAALIQLGRVLEGPGHWRACPSMVCCPSGSGASGHSVCRAFVCAGEREIAARDLRGHELFTRRALAGASSCRELLARSLVTVEQHSINTIHRRAPARRGARPLERLELRRNATARAAPITGAWTSRSNGPWTRVGVSGARRRDTSANEEQ